MEKLIKDMISIGCLKISPSKPFTYASGLKGPIYCDNRLILSFPKIRNLVATEFKKLIEENSLTYDHIAGVATAGIPHAAFLSHLMQSSMAYVRNSPKSHGTQKIVEGAVKKGEDLLLIEDLINQGSSISGIIQNLRQQGFQVKNILCIVDYQTKVASNILKSLNVDHFPLINFTELTETLFRQKIIDDIERNLLYSWQDNPQAWNK